MGSDLLPFLTMVIVQLGYAGMNIISKLAMDSGMNAFVHVAYRQIFATIAIAPFAYFLERKTRPKLTPSILFQIFLCSIFGVSMNQITYFVGLKNTTPTIACALSNLTPAVTFLLAIPFGLERMGLGTKAGQAKMLGTILCVGGAMLLSFYHGSIVPIDQPNIHWKYAQDMTENKSTSNHGNFIFGPFLLIVSAVSWGIWSILQARVSMVYPAPYSSSALMCLMASFQCLIVGFCFDHNISDWSLSHSIRAVSAIYAGVVCTALAYCLMSWCIERKGPLYVSVFNPLLLVIVAALSWALLQEKIYIGTVVGSVLIVLGLYGVLWGKNNELKPVKFDEEIGVQEISEKEKQKKDIEMQLCEGHQQGSIIVHAIK
ncbi:WAT1-related protein At1g09380-like [Lycium barbarum]|uniref:WAT1-related protein At1g09380-like n=1 Tax=Lycium barbarum TaxID=112863 RepID=UPI00293E212C|nr:WAT1-related protein At1g09380-like [Lycium barbarum]